MCLLVCLFIWGLLTSRFPALLGGIIHPTSRIFLLLLLFTIKAPAVLNLHTGARQACLSSHVPSCILSASTFFHFDELLSRSRFLSHSPFWIPSFLEHVCAASSCPKLIAATPAGGSQRSLGGCAETRCLVWASQLQDLQFHTQTRPPHSPLSTCGLQWSPSHVLEISDFLSLITIESTETKLQLYTECWAEKHQLKKVICSGAKTTI